MTTDQNQIPVDVEAEQAVIGALLIDPDALPRVQALDLRAREFQRLDHRLIYEAITELSRQGRAADYITVCSLLEQTPHNSQQSLQFIGGPPAVSRLITRTVSSANVAHYAGLVKLAAWRRELLTATGRLASLAYSGVGTVPELQQQAQYLLRPAMALEEPQSHLYGSDDALVDYLGRQVEREDLLAANPNLLVTLPWPDLGHYYPQVEPGMVHVVGARPGVGKCLALGTKVIMFDGSMEPVEYLMPGDLLMGPDSKPRKILSMARGRAQMYWVRQNKGMDYRVNGAHILALLEDDKKHEPFPTEKTVEEFMALPVAIAQRRFKGYKVAIDFPQRYVPLDPYFLGLWLGDGCSRNSSVYVADQEVAAYLEEYARAIGCTARSIPDTSPGVSRVTVSLGRGRKLRRNHTPGMVLGKMGLLRDWREERAGNHAPSEKRIPRDYLVNCERIRLELLAGLVDSDGYYGAGTGCYEIVQKDESLCRQIKWLADSLGFGTSLTQKQATLKSREYSCSVWRVLLWGDLERVPVKIERKKAPPRRINKNWRATGIRIEKDTVDEYFGFILDGDGLFLLEDMTVTHNTIYLEGIAEHNARRGHACAFYHLELSHMTMLHRRMARHSGIEYHMLSRGYHGPEVNQALGRMREWQRRMTYIHCPGWSAERIMADALRLNAEGKADVVVIDYLQKLAMPEMRGRNESSVIGATVGTIKNGAERLGLPVFLACQVTRDLKQRGATGRPQLTDLFGSGLIEAYCNHGCIIHRPASADDEVSEVHEFYAEKNTTGRTGRVDLLSVPGRFMFAQISVRSPETGEWFK